MGFVGDLGVCVAVSFCRGSRETRLVFCFRDYMQTILSVNFSLTYPYLFMHFFCVDALLFF